MSPGLSVIVGLGNPGAAYEATRHNAGRRFVDAVRRGRGAAWRADTHFAADLARVSIEGADVWLAAPTTFMNHSGEAVARFAHYYKIPIDRILVAHDELDLPPGTVRVKQGGGDGGHNGLHDVIEKLGSPEFLRLRIGIGHPGSAAQVLGYVLQQAPPAEQAAIDAAVAAATEQIGDLVRGEYQRVMNVLHARKV